MDAQGCWPGCSLQLKVLMSNLQKGPSAAQRVSLLAELQGSCAGTQLLSLRQPLLRLAVDPQSAGLLLCTQHLSVASQGALTAAVEARGFAAAALMGSAAAAPAAAFAGLADSSDAFIAVQHVDIRKAAKRTARGPALRLLLLIGPTCALGRYLMGKNEGIKVFHRIP